VPSLLIWARRLGATETIFLFDTRGERSLSLHNFSLKADRETRICAEPSNLRWVLRRFFLFDTRGERSPSLHNFSLKADRETRICPEPFDLHSTLRSDRGDFILFDTQGERSPSLHNIPSQLNYLTNSSHVMITRSRIRQTNRVATICVNNILLPPCK